MEEDYDLVFDTRKESKKYNGKSVENGKKFDYLPPEFTVEVDRAYDEFGRIPITELDEYLARRNEAWKLLENTSNASIDISAYISEFDNDSRGFLRGKNEKSIVLEVPVINWVKSENKKADEELEERVDKKRDLIYFEGQYLSTKKLYVRLGGHLKELNMKEPIKGPDIIGLNVPIIKLKPTSFTIANSMVRPYIYAHPDCILCDYYLVDQYGVGLDDKYQSCWSKTSYSTGIHPRYGDWTEYNKESKNGIIIGFPEEVYMTHVKVSIKFTIRGYCIQMPGERSNPKTI